MVYCDGRRLLLMGAWVGGRRDRELAKVEIRQEDVDLLVAQFEVRPSESSPHMRPSSTVGPCVLAATTHIATFIPQRLDAASPIVRRWEAYGVQGCDSRRSGR